MADLRFVPLGVGDAFSALFYSTSLALVADDGQWLLVDCPHPIRKILREASVASGIDLRLSQLVGIVLTHLHSDHASGLEGIGAYFKFVLGTPKPPDIFLGPGVLAALAERSDAKYFNLVPVESVRHAGPFTIEARTVTHGDLPACAFRFAVAGRSLGHSGDTIFDPELIRWLAAADLLIHEAGADSEASEYHTAYSCLAALPAELRNKMRLAHYCDEFDVAVSVIEPLVQWRVYRV